MNAPRKRPMGFTSGTKTVVNNFGINPVPCSENARVNLSTDPPSRKFNKKRFASPQRGKSPPFSWSVCVRQRGRNCLPDVTGLARGFFSYRRQSLEPLIRILRTPISLRLSADNSPDAFRVRPRPRDPVRHAQAGLVIQLGGRSRQAAPTFPQLPGAILRAFK